MRPLALFALLALLLGASFAGSPPARADTQQRQNFSIWRQMDNCTKQANKQFPDHTPNSNAKREAARDACLRAHRLPVAAPVTPPPR